MKAELRNSGSRAALQTSQGREEHIPTQTLKLVWIIYMISVRLGYMKPCWGAPCLPLWMSTIPTSTWWQTFTNIYVLITRWPIISLICCYDSTSMHSLSIPTSRDKYGTLVFLLTYAIMNESSLYSRVGVCDFIRIQSRTGSTNKLILYLSTFYTVFVAWLHTMSHASYNHTVTITLLAVHPSISYTA